MAVEARRPALAQSFLSVNRRSPFVGRAAELAELALRLDRAAQGESGVVLIAGEAGIGKTRLLQEFADLARRAGWLVLSGKAYDTEGMPPYLPFVEAIRERVPAATEAELLTLVEEAPSITALIPELRGRTATVPPRQSLPPEAERFRLFEAVSASLLGAALARETRGLLLCLDDLHWADPSSLLLLLHLARELEGARVLVAGTYRPEEIGQSGALFNTLADLVREGLDDRITLSRLSAPETEALVEVLNGTRPAQAVALAIQRETAGNPFFVQEVVRLLRSEGLDLASAGEVVGEWRVPGGVREVIGKRLSHLSDDSRRLLEAAAVLGDGFDFELAAAVCGNSTGYLMAALEGALAGGMLVEEGGAYRFGHPLVQRTLYDGLSLVRRQTLHLRAAEAMEAAFSPRLDEHLAALANHYGLASSAPAKTFEFSRRAGEAAIAVFAWQEAVGHYERALQTLDRAPRSAAEHCDLLIGLIAALMPAGRCEEVLRKTAPLAYELAESLPDQARMGAVARSAVDASGRLWGAAGLTTAEGALWLQRASEHTKPGTPERIFVDWRVTSRLTAMGGQQTADDVENYRAARALGNREALFAAATGPLNGPPSSPRLLHLSQSVLTEMTGEASDGVSPRTLALFLPRAAECHLLFGDRAGFEKTADEIVRLAAKVKDSIVIDSSILVELIRCVVDGNLSRAVDLLEHSGRSSRLHLLISRVHGARINMWLGRAGRVQEMLEGMPEFYVSEAAPQIWRPARAWLLAALGRTDEAKNQLRQWLSEAEPVEDAKIWELGAALDAAVLLGDADLARRLSLPLQPVAHLPSGGFLALVSVGRLLGEGSELQEDYPAARSYYEVALRAAEMVRFRPEIALTRLHLGELLLKHYPAERPAAIAHLDFAIAEFEAMGMRPALERARRLRGRRRTAREAKEPAYPDGLSEREVEVLRLIAAGKSNREIGEELVLSVRTVERHITNIYAKIGARGKADATAYGLRHTLI